MYEFSQAEAFASLRRRSAWWVWWCRAKVTQLLLSQNMKNLFAATDHGGVRLYRHPMTGDYVELQVGHLAPVQPLHRQKIQEYPQFFTRLSHEGEEYQAQRSP